MVLRKHERPVNFGIKDAVHHEVKDEPLARKWNCGFCALRGKRKQALAFPSRKNHGDYIFHFITSLRKIMFECIKEQSINITRKKRFVKSSSLNSTLKAQWQGYRQCLY